MWQFYFIMLCMLSSAIIIPLIRGKNISSVIYLILNIGLLTFLAMFRAVDIGNDTDTYVNLFYNILNGAEITNLSSRFEIGYLYLNKFLSFFSSNHQILLIVTSIYIFVILGRFIYKYSKIPWLSVFLFFSLRYYDISLSGIRQMLAIATILIAYDFILKKKPIKFIFTIIIAGSFHTAAYLFLIAYPLVKYKLNKKIVYGAVLVSVILYVNLNTVLNIVLGYFPRYYSYVENNSEDLKISTLLGLGVTILILVFCEILNKSLVFYKRRPINVTKIQSQNLKSQEDQIQSILLLMSCVIMFVALKVDMIQRLENIFSIFSIIYLPNSIEKISDKNIRIITILITITLFFMHITAIHEFRPEWQSTFPFKFFWN